MRCRRGSAANRVNGCSVTLSYPARAKFDLVRALAADVDVRDIDVHLPSLNDVYRHYSDLGAKT